MPAGRNFCGLFGAGVYAAAETLAQPLDEVADENRAGDVPGLKCTIVYKPIIYSPYVFKLLSGPYLMSL